MCLISASVEYRIAIICVWGLAILGCGHGDSVRINEETVSASGVLTYRGEPLAHHQVTLTPTGETPAVGVSDEQGKFVLGTNRPRDGAVVGEHKVSVVYAGPPGGSFDGMNDFSPPPPPKVEIPAIYGNAKTSGITVDIPDSGSQDLKIDLK